jgi:DNA-binding response OmpR family regulator
MPEVATVLVVDDDPTVSEVVRGYLERAGFTVEHAGDGVTGLAMARATRPDLIVLDVMLPGLDGIEVCRQLRSDSRVPIVMLTALGGEVDRVLGLQVGADDYLTKPFSPRELVLRVQSVLRRAGSDGATAEAAGRNVLGAGELLAGRECLSDGDVLVDLAARRATMAGRELALTMREFDLLAHLLRHPGRAFSRDELMHHVWGWEFGDVSTVTVHVRRLRAKVEGDPARPVRLVTVWGVGYRWDGAAAGGTARTGDAAVSVQAVSLQGVARPETVGEWSR